MLWAIFSDIHSNGPALDAVLEAIRREAPDQLLCLGDLVGYGPHPKQVLDKVREIGCPVIAGNHDLACAGALEFSNFNIYARTAVEWTARKLAASDRDYLLGLPFTHDAPPIAAVHGTRDAPEEFLYLQSTEHAAQLLESQPQPVGVYGHTHVPLTFARRRGEVTLSFAAETDLRGADRVLINVGSVGQPRDEDPRATFALFDDTKHLVRIRRVAYDIDVVARDIRSSGLPGLLADRLRYGV